MHGCLSLARCLISLIKSACSCLNVCLFVVPPVFRVELVRDARRDAILRRPRLLHCFIELSIELVISRSPILVSPGSFRGAALSTSPFSVELAQLGGFSSLCPVSQRRQPFLPRDCFGGGNTFLTATWHAAENKRKLAP